jgi:hypothetical protein
LNEVKKQIEKALAQFDCEHKFSDWELGQADGLRWALDIIKAIKSPEDYKRNQRG